MKTLHIALPLFFGKQSYEKATSRLKEIKEKKHIYWALHHGPFRDELWPAWHKFCTANNIVSEYTTKQADEDIKKVMDIVKDAMDGLVDKKGNY